MSGMHPEDGRVDAPLLPATCCSTRTRSGAWRGQMQAGVQSDESRRSALGGRGTIREQTEKGRPRRNRALTLQADQLPQEVENLPTPQVPATTAGPSWHLGFPGRVHDPAMRTSGSLGTYLLAALAAGCERHGENLRAEGLLYVSSSVVPLRKCTVGRTRSGAWRGRGQLGAAPKEPPPPNLRQVRL